MAKKKGSSGKQRNQVKSRGGRPAGKKRPGNNSTAMTTIIIGVALALGIVGGIVVWSLTNSSDGLALPDFAYAASAPKQAPQGYQAALDIPEYLEQIPCYCGCGQYDGHKNNLDCFIESRQGDKVEWDDHAAG
ncbi:hypothetical protein BMS3Abin01_00120 [bacterium BMS3Abin01]|nr:hypothetical protein BMS3Abin01_00120 [bacterium BMS3Abin01]HDZ59648.1 hypothetical protein [Actinomycetota bacterium]